MNHAINFAIILIILTLLFSSGFPAGRLEKKTSVELLWLLDRKRMIAPNKYDKLKEILCGIGRQDLADCYFDRNGE